MASKIRVTILSMSLEGWKTFFEMTGVILLFLTFVFGAGAFWTSTRINARQAAQLRQFDKDLTNAKDALSKQQERAANAELEVARIRGKTEELRKQNLTTETKLEAERLDRLKLEAQIAPRRLGAAQKTTISRACRSFAGRHVSVVSFTSDVEGAILAQQIIAALREAGLRVDDQAAKVLPLQGFTFGVHVEGPDAKLRDGIASALASAGLDVAPPGPLPITLSESEATILVATKPITQ